MRYIPTFLVVAGIGLMTMELGLKQNAAATARIEYTSLTAQYSVFKIVLHWPINNVYEVNIDPY